MTTVTVRDETVAGGVFNEWALHFSDARVTVFDILRSRVYVEVEDFNKATDVTFRGLVQPLDTEVTPSGFRMKKRRPLDPAAQLEKAVEAFDLGRVLILVGDHQVSRLDEAVDLFPSATVSFVRLLPLVGG